jgi:hypothetical protein
VWEVEFVCSESGDGGWAWTLVYMLELRQSCRNSGIIFRVHAVWEYRYCDFV